MKTPRRAEFTVTWPVQGIACFRAGESELVLSDCYWRWICDELSRAERCPFVEAVEGGFTDATQLVETIPVTPEFLDLLRQVAPSKAPSFERLVPSDGCVVPTAEQVLAEFERLVVDAVSHGSMEMEIE